MCFSAGWLRKESEEGPLLGYYPLVIEKWGVKRKQREREPEALPPWTSGNFVMGGIQPGHLLNPAKLLATGCELCPGLLLSLSARGQSHPLGTECVAV